MCVRGRRLSCLKHWHTRSDSPSLDQRCCSEAKRGHRNPSLRSINIVQRPEADGRTSLRKRDLHLQSQGSNGLIKTVRSCCNWLIADVILSWSPGCLDSLPKRKPSSTFSRSSWGNLKNQSGWSCGTPQASNSQATLQISPKPQVLCQKQASICSGRHVSDQDNHFQQLIAQHPSCLCTTSQRETSVSSSL